MRLVPPRWYCPQCGQPYPEGLEFCTNCNFKLRGARGVVAGSPSFIPSVIQVKKAKTASLANVDRSSRYEIGGLVIYGGRVRKVLGRRKTSEGWAYDLE